MNEERFERWNDYSCKVKDNYENTLLDWEDVIHKLNEQQATIESLKKDLKIWYVELMLNTPREHSLWVEDVVEKYSFLKELDDE